MAGDDRADNLDLMCLKALRVNGESERVALAAASIVVHAHAIAREVPGQADGARRIVELARTLYAALPSRPALAEMVDDCLAELASGPAARRRAGAARDRLVDRLWTHFHRGAAAARRPGACRSGAAVPDRAPLARLDPPSDPHLGPLHGAHLARMIRADAGGAAGPGPGPVPLEVERD